MEAVMARLKEEEFYCSKCKTSLKLPYCCGKTMERDDFVFFCTICGKESTFPMCCDEQMTIRKKVLDIRKEIFGKY
jgi:hypothetical protein